MIMMAVIVPILSVVTVSVMVMKLKQIVQMTVRRVQIAMHESLILPITDLNAVIQPGMNMVLIALHWKVTIVGIVLVVIALVIVVVLMVAQMVVATVMLVM